jgi:hypothetical protein
VTMPDLTIFEKINANLKTLEIDEIKEQLKDLIKGMAVASPVFDPGAFLYRARKLDSAFNKTLSMRYADLIYPRKEIAKSGST